VIPIVSTVGCSNSNKASYLKQSVPELMPLGFRIYVVKQDVHGFEKDMPREDTRQLKRADAGVVLTSRQTFLDTRLTLIFPKGTAIRQNTTTFCFLRNTNTGEYPGYTISIRSLESGIFIPSRTIKYEKFSPTS